MHVYLFVRCIFWLCYGFWPTFSFWTFILLFISCCSLFLCLFSIIVFIELTCFLLHFTAFFSLNRVCFTLQPLSLRFFSLPSVLIISTPCRPCLPPACLHNHVKWAKWHGICLHLCFLDHLLVLDDGHSWLPALDYLCWTSLFFHPLLL